MINKRVVGSHYEKMAVDYLREQGYEIVRQNYRCKAGEIDIIAKEQMCLCFIEVKYRKDMKHGYPQEAVTVAKQKKIIRTAAHYILEYGYPKGMYCRFDVVGITSEQIWLIRNAFEMIK